ncbi:protein of unknown function [Acetoanaerobium sticklandii]|uniref:Uncharacterized protein n=1 Tax=Acetoanaerobium sticklandii (strain ATCC 12662 / DSM 519 / JCM 1433 / CCUG 9281 / NCIMB 10654 / HF) TaxID=499177 RepID=E3PWD0_ACESD|nr:protein of unknown function [Acetoanaerobium sticklandii]
MFSSTIPSFSFFSISLKPFLNKTAERENINKSIISFNSVSIGSRLLTAGVRIIRVERTSLFVLSIFLSLKK